MSIIKKDIPLFFFIFLPLFLPSQKKVAVMETTRVANEVTTMQCQMVRGGLETAVANTPGYEGYDRASFDAIMREHNFQRSGAVSDTQIRKLCEMAEVQYVIVSEAKAEGGNFYILVKMFDVETGKYGATYDKLCSTSVVEIKEACAELGAKLLAPIHRKGELAEDVEDIDRLVLEDKSYDNGGEVIQPDKGVEDYYPKNFCGLRLKTAHCTLNNVLNTEVKTDTIGVVNMTNAPMRVSFQNVPKHISIRMEPSALAARKPYDKMGQEGNIIVTYDGKRKDDWGFLQDIIAVVVNDSVDSKNRITVSATLVEDFSHLSPDELANAPKIVFAKTEYDFGTIRQGAKPTYEFYFRNEGKTNLIIRKVKASCGCTVPKQEKTVIGPGEKSYIKVTFDSAGKKGHQSKSITITTNDPTNSSMVVKMIGNVDD